MMAKVINKKGSAVKNDPAEPLKKKSRLGLRQKLYILAVVVVLALILNGSKELFVAATVNGQPISRLRVVRELEKQSGKQALESIINEALIYQEAKKAGISVSEADVNAKSEEIKSQLSSQGQDLDAMLSAQGMSQEDFKKQIKIQIYLEKLLAEKTEVTDEAISAYLEESKAYIPEKLSDEEKKKMAKDELTQRNLSTAFSAWLTETKANSSINYFVEY